MKIAIIGAGVSGLASAKILLENGYTVTIFERGEKAGGQWNFAYPGASSQNTKFEYEFSDFRHKSSTSLHPTTEEILEYIEQYISHFGLNKYILYQHEIISMKQEHNGWELKINNKLQSKAITEHFDFVLVAKGQFSDNPVLPQRLKDEILNEKRVFQGQILHSRQYTSREQIRGKKVVVVGFGKTALDVAQHAGEIGSEAHLVYKTPRWSLPMKILGIHFATILFARHATFLMNSWFLGPIQRFLQSYLPFVPFMFWRTIEMAIRISHGFGWNHPLVPKERFELQLRSAVAVFPPPLYKLIKSKKIKLYQSEIVDFTSNQVVLANGTKIEADLVISCTGFKSDLNILDQFRNLLEDDGFHLYRHMIHPDIPNLAFSGSNHSFLHIPGVEVGTYWLMALLEGKLKLPSREEQLKSIQQEKEFKRKNMIFESTRSATVGPRFHSYIDQLCKDLGVDWRRKSNFLLEVATPTIASDFKGFGELVTKKLKKV